MIKFKRGELLTAARCAAAIVKPIEMDGVTMLLLLASSHTEWITKIRTRVIKASTTNPCPGCIKGFTEVLPKPLIIASGVTN